MPTTRRKVEAPKSELRDNFSMARMIGNGLKMCGSVLAVILIVVLILAVIAYYLMVLWEWVMGVHIV